MGTGAPARPQRSTPSVDAADVASPAEAKTSVRFRQAYRRGSIMLTPAESLDDAVRSLRVLILAGENYRQATAQMSGLGVTETQAVSYLSIYGERGQNDLGGDLGISSGASTALVDRLERQGVAQRYAHPHDRRRVIVRLTEKGHGLVARSHSWLAASFGSIPPEDLPTLSSRLRQIAQVLRTESERQVAADQE